MSRPPSSGFTLIELMIIVAMIGILATIAVSNYQSYLAKSRQAEAKMALGAMISAEKMFAAESGSFTLCLDAAGYAPASSNRYYRAGFTWFVADANNCGPMNNGTCAATGWNSNGVPTGVCPFGPVIGLGHQVFPSTAYVSDPTCDIFPIPASVINRGQILIGVSGSVSSDGTCDRWSIDQNNLLKQY